MAKSRTNPHEAKVKEIRDNFAEDYQHWEEIYRQGDRNMAAIAGDPWNAQDRKAREEAERPVVTFDELGQYLNQEVNSVRMNPIAPKFTPEGDGANDDTARFYANHLRRTEYRCNAQEGYTTCYENALQRGFGFVRLRLEYEHERSFYQQVAIDPVPNPNCCYPDCNSMRADGSDWKRFTFIESYTRSEFERAFPEAEFTNFSAEQIMAVGNRWMGENRCQVAEYWEIEEEDQELVQYEVPATKTKPARYVEAITGIDRKPRGGRVVQRRTTQIKHVYQYITNGVELLEAAPGEADPTVYEYPGTMIPFAPCYGKIVWINDGGGPKRKILAMTTLALEPFMAFCFLASCELEAIGTITKNPYWAYEGQLDANLKNRVKESLHQPVAILEAKASLPNLPNVLLPLPQRNPMSVDLSAYALAKEGARRAIQAAMGAVPMLTPMQRDKQKLSGRALDRMDDQSTKGNYHFKDHYKDLVRRVGVIYEDVIDKIMDVEREVVTLQADKETKRVLINAKQRPQDLPKDVDYLPSVKGRHGVTVDVGPEFESERAEAGEFLDNFIASPLFVQLEPPKRNKLLAVGIRERLSGPMGQKMADIVDPQRKEGELPPAEELMAALQEAQQAIIPGLQQQIAALQQEKQAKVVETQGKLAAGAQADKTKVAIAEMQTKQKADDTKIDSVTALELQDMKRDLALEIQEAKTQIELLKLQLQGLTTGATLESGEREGAEGRALTEREGERGRQAAAAEGDKGREATAAEGQANREAAERAAAQKPKGDNS